MSDNRLFFRLYLIILNKSKSFLRFNTIELNIVFLKLTLNEQCISYKLSMYFCSLFITISFINFINTSLGNINVIKLLKSIFSINLFKLE